MLSPKEQKEIPMEKNVMGWTDMRLWAHPGCPEVTLVLLQPWGCDSWRDSAPANYSDLVWSGWTTVWVARIFPQPYQSVPENRHDPWWNSSPYLVSGDRKDEKWSGHGLPHPISLQQACFKPCPPLQEQAGTTPVSEVWRHATWREQQPFISLAMCP